MSRWPWLGRACMVLALAAGGWAAVTVLAGGFVVDIGALRVSSRDPLRPFVAALVFLAAARLTLGAVEFRRLAAQVTGARRGTIAARIAGAAALSVLVFSIAWNTRAAGGSDSSCYVLQAEAFARGRVSLQQSLGPALPGSTPAMFAPGGFVPSPRAPHDPVPICGPGLALAMVAPFLAGRDAVFLVVPAFAVLAVWLTFAFGRRLDDEVTGACAAVLVACSPIFLYQAVQPMTDVPAAAAWMAALVFAGGARRRDTIAAGVATSVAILIRPNLAPLAIPLLALGAFRSTAKATGGLSAFRRNLLFVAAMTPGIALLLALNAARYGAPLASGYGDTGTLFSVAHLAPNAARYSRWLLETHTPFLLLALAAPWVIPRGAGKRRLTMVSLAGAALIVATYLAYTVFDDWWYIRFLLPALPVLIVLSVAVFLQLTERLSAWLPPSAFAEATADSPRPWRRRSGGRSLRAPAAIFICVLLGTWHVHVARTRQVFDLQALESRFVVTGRYAARALPGNAVVLAGQHSGSIRFHGGRSTIAWDAIAPDALDATVATLRGAGHVPFLALEDAEEPRFRARFASQRAGRLDWPPHAQIDAPVRVRVYDPAERDSYLAGGASTTEHVR